MSATPIIEITGLKNYLGKTWVHQNVNLQIMRGEIFGIIGGSGSGKTTIFRNILMLLKQTAGQIKIFNHNISEMSPTEINNMRHRFGVLFQHSALFSSMTVLENVMFPMQNFTQLDADFIKALALMKIALVGLPAHAAEKFPAELSGGMQRRAAAARALAMDPELLFLDEPTSGLDPQSARLFDELIVFLRNTLQLTIVMISHDMQSLQYTTDKIAFLGDGQVLDVAPFNSLCQNKHHLIAEYFKKIIS